MPHPSCQLLLLRHLQHNCCRTHGTLQGCCYVAVCCCVTCKHTQPRRQCGRETQTAETLGHCRHSTLVTGAGGDGGGGAAGGGSGALHVPWFPFHPSPTAMPTPPLTAIWHRGEASQRQVHSNDQCIHHIAICLRSLHMEHWCIRKQPCDKARGIVGTLLDCS